MGDRTPQQVLGRSEFDSDPEDLEADGSDYRPGSRQQLAIKSLAAKDPSFVRYLNSNGIDIDRLADLTNTTRAANIRKIISLVRVRNEFRGVARARSRKTLPASLYRGERSFFAMVEGNPRLLIGIGNRILDAMGKAQSASDVVQVGEIARAERHFLSLLATMPVRPATAGKPLSLQDLIGLIGKYFHSEVVNREFQDDPAGSFIIDDSVPEHVVHSLGDALNVGAIIYVPPPNSPGAVLRNLRRCRFRISYLLAPEYKLPLILMQEISLSTILGNVKDARGLVEPIQQAMAFTEVANG